MKLAYIKTDIKQYVKLKMTVVTYHKAYKKKLFEPYFTTKGDEGTGVELYMCQNIIRTRFEGDIHFESLGGHTTFFITI